jgi:hypothetical protein
MQTPPLRRAAAHHFSIKLQRVELARSWTLLTNGALDPLCDLLIRSDMVVVAVVPVHTRLKG